MIPRTKPLFVILIITALCSFLVSSNASAESIWPQFRGPNMNGIAPSQAIPKDFSTNNKLIWKIPTPTGHSSPSIWRNKIFITGHNKKNFKYYGNKRVQFQKYASMITLRGTLQIQPQQLMAI